MDIKDEKFSTLLTRAVCLHTMPGLSGISIMVGKEAEAELDRRFPVSAPVKDTVLDAVKDIKDTIAAKDAEIERLRGILAESMRLLGGKDDTSTAFLARVPEQIKSLDDTMRKRNAELLAQASEIYAAKRDLTTCESLLRAERATVSRLADAIRSLKSQGDERYHQVVAIADALGVVATQDDILAAITALRASALVVPDGLLDARPLPWVKMGVANVQDSNGATVLDVETNASWMLDGELASAIVKAANGGAK